MRKHLVSMQVTGRIREEASFIQEERCVYTNLSRTVKRPHRIRDRKADGLRYVQLRLAHQGPAERSHIKGATQFPLLNTKTAEKREEA